MSRDRLPPRSGFLAFFPRGWSRRSRSPVSCADVISIGRCRQHVAAPHTYCGSLAVEMTRAEKRPEGALRPRNLSVPSYRPTQKGGGTFAVRQFAAGAGEGQHTFSWCDHRRMSRCQSGCPITRSGLRGHGLGAPVRSRTQGDPQCSALLRRTLCASSEASGAPALRPTPGETGAYRRPCGVFTWNRPPAPAAGPGGSTLCPGRVFSPV